MEKKSEMDQEAKGVISSLLNPPSGPVGRMPRMSVFIKEKAQNWMDLQTKTFTRWANIYLLESGSQVNDLSKDFCDGTNLIRLLESLSGKSLGKYKASPKVSSQRIENINKCLEFMRKEGVKLVNVGAQDIMSGNHKIILGLIWKLILTYHMENLETPDNAVDERRASSTGTGGRSKVLLEFVNLMISKYGINVSNFTSDWQDGRVLSALTNSLGEEEPIDMDELGEDPFEETEKAMEIAENYYQIPRVVDPEDLIRSPDPQSVMTYVSYFQKKVQNADDEEKERIKEAQQRINPSDCTLEFSEWKAGKKNRVRLTLVDEDGLNIDDIEDDCFNYCKIEATCRKLKDENGAKCEEEDEIPVNISIGNNATYLIEGKPSSAGTYELSVLVNGKHISSSPYLLDVQEISSSSKVSFKTVDIQAPKEKEKKEEKEEAEEEEVGHISFQKDHETSLKKAKLGSIEEEEEEVVNRKRDSYQLRSEKPKYVDSSSQTELTVEDMDNFENKFFMISRQLRRGSNDPEAAALTLENEAVNESSNSNNISTSKIGRKGGIWIGKEENKVLKPDGIKEGVPAPVDSKKDLMVSAELTEHEFIESEHVKEEEIHGSSSTSSAGKKGGIWLGKEESKKGQNVERDGKLIGKMEEESEVAGGYESETVSGEESSKKSTFDRKGGIWLGENVKGVPNKPLKDGVGAPNDNSDTEFATGGESESIDPSLGSEESDLQKSYAGNKGGIWIGKEEEKKGMNYRKKEGVGAPREEEGNITFTGTENEKIDPLNNLDVGSQTEAVSSSSKNVSTSTSSNETSEFDDHKIENLISLDQEDDQQAEVVEFNEHTYGKMNWDFKKVKILVNKARSIGLKNRNLISEFNNKEVLNRNLIETQKKKIETLTKSIKRLRESTNSMRKELKAYRQQKNWKDKYHVLAARLIRIQEDTRLREITDITELSDKGIEAANYRKRIKEYEDTEKLLRREINAHKRRLEGVKSEYQVSQQDLKKDILDLKDMLSKAQIEVTKARGEEGKRNILIFDSKTILAEMKPKLKIMWSQGGKTQFSGIMTRTIAAPSTSFSGREDEKEGSDIDDDEEEEEENYGKDALINAANKLGLLCKDITEEEGLGYGGVMITSITKNGPADRGGFKEGDIIENVDGHNLTSYVKLLNIIEGLGTGDKTSWIVRRKGAIYNVKGEVVAKSFTIKTIKDLQRIASGIVRNGDDELIRGIRKTTKGKKLVSSSSNTKIRMKRAGTSYNIDENTKKKGLTESASNKDIPKSRLQRAKTGYS